MGSSQTRNRTQVSCICRWILYQLSHKGSPWFGIKIKLVSLVKTNWEKENLSKELGAKDKGKLVIYKWLWTTDLLLYGYLTSFFFFSWDFTSCWNFSCNSFPFTFGLAFYCNNNILKLPPMNYEKCNYYSTSFEYCLIFHPLVQFLLILHLQR